MNVLLNRLSFAATRSAYFSSSRLMSSNPVILPGPVVDTAFLSKNAGRVKVLDASWHMPSSGIDPKKDFILKRIPGAQYFDIEDIRDKATDLPHMLPKTEEDFGAAVGQLGIANNDAIVVYDTVGVFSSARCWWMFNVYGHTNVAVLDGGLPKWVKEGRPTESGPVATPTARKFHAVYNGSMVRSFDDISRNLETKGEQVVDARTRERFLGSVAEPRPGLASGHIPGARNVHFAKLLSENGTFKDPEQIRKIFEDAGVKFDRPITTSCGSGVTAAILTMALRLIGYSNTALYDGSWSEYGGKHGAKIEKGEPPLNS